MADQVTALELTSATRRKGLPNFWVTGLAKILVGDQPCELEAWMKAHYDLAKRPQSASMTKWKMDHTAQLQAEVQRLKALGHACEVEQYFRVTGGSAIISGKPDVISRDGETYTIRDVKSGTARDSDVAQVMIYQLLIPMVWKRAIVFEGEVIYPGKRVPVKPLEAEAVREKLFALVRRLATDTRPEASPSSSACRFCDVTAIDCKVRFSEGKDVDVLTSEF